MNLAALWRTRNPVAVLLLPLAALFTVLSALRRRAYAAGVLRSTRLPVPVIVIGNISAGGTGKTPLTIALVRELIEAGFKPSVVSRGYGGNARSWPQWVSPASNPAEVGDEPVFIAQAAQCPVAVAPRRVDAAQLLLAKSDCDVILCDDGLQHYALARDIEIAVVDRAHGFGNGWRIPAGPLRESPSRLASVDFVVVRGTAGAGEYAFEVRAARVRRMAEPGDKQDVGKWRGRRVHAVAGIGIPARFFAQLREAGLDVIEHPFPDHHRYVCTDLEFGDDLPVLMTEKDAVKCAGFPLERLYSVSARPELDPRLVPDIIGRLRKRNV